MSLFFNSSTKTALPSGDFMLTVIERLLQFNMVKYRLSALGMSRSWPRVASPAGDSNLITSAPIHASSCEEVGPACTCVMSRTRIPFNASICLYSPLKLLGQDGILRWSPTGAGGVSPAVPQRIDNTPTLFVHGLVRGARRIDVAVDNHVHQRWEP